MEGPSPPPQEEAPAPEQGAAAEEQFRLLADHAPVMIWRSDTSRACVFFNKSWLDFTGRSLEQELGFGWTEGVHPDDFDRCLRIFAAAFRERRAFTMDYRLRRHDGVWRWVVDNGRPYFDGEGRFAGYFGSCIDITERKEAEAALERALAAKDELVQELNHRLRNNLGTISSLLSLQAAQLAEPAMRDAFRRSAARIRRMALVQDLAHEALDGAEVELGALLGRLPARLAGETGQDKIAFEIGAERLALPPARAIPLGLLAAEAISNALLHAFPDGRHGRVRIELVAPPDGLRLTIADDGIGIPAARQHGGPGLGLLVMRGLASQLGGRLRIEPDAGTKVILAAPSPPS
ncbi:MAG TPA: PAS domain S-box protein [Geminicoccaceae bacterium]|nr:PAS domain S-box protein [Geminicoccaceae bacterium]